MYLYKDVLPFTVMVALECTNVGTNTLFKAATDRGMSYYVFVVYSYALASLILLPSPLLHRYPFFLSPSLSFGSVITLCLHVIDIINRGISVGKFGV